ncbi:hypothetical protein GO001_22750 [Streptomyces sp. NRRL B-1677]|uniref:hypothetical protein n=1 Tax=Streptomyces sp. NRRL B-1677 TaxID=2682966 RepID=UPI001892A1E4|nr:hypothetical protein [Streptomyces sp. NRRL B-1677]MBF6048001.1 hypothetical protein [Streptomyces sp. NRRL B-1677]
MDRRLIQTAVFGSPDSDEPALCPETVEELEVFRREHAGDTIWCGTKFEGGCGRQLMTRSYTDKICHFAHYRSDGTSYTCGRKDRGKDSADHLFAKAHLASWLRTQGIAAEFTFPEPMGSAVMVCLADGRTLLVHLDRNQPVTWDPNTWETILGPGVRDPYALTQRGYLHRVRFDDRPGGGRTMQFGTEIYGRGTDRWDSLDDIALTSDGLVSKTVPTVVRAPATAQQSVSTSTEREIVTIIPHTAHNPRRADPVQEVLRHLDIDHGSPRDIRASATAIQRLLESNLAPDDANRLRFALRRCERRLEEHAQLRRKVVQQLKENPTEALYYEAVGLMKNDPDVSQEQKDVVDALTARMQQARVEKRAAEKRARAERREAQEREREVRRRALEREWAEKATAVERALAEARERAVQQARVEKVEKLAPAVRGALKKAARESRTTTWPELQEKTGMRQLGRLDHRDKVELLALVEADTAPEEPLWSTLLAAADDSASLGSV